MFAISLQIKLFYYLTDIVCFALLVKSKKSFKSIKGIATNSDFLITISLEKMLQTLDISNYEFC